MSRKDPVHVILNPAANGGRGGRLAPRLEEGLRARGLAYALTSTRGPGHAAELAEEIAREGRTTRLLVVGGDGTVHEVANGFLRVPDRTPALAVVPVGTGNDFYRMVGTEKGLSDALDVLVEGTPHRFDVGRVRFDGGESHFVNLLGLGVDVEVLRRRNGYRHLSGLPQYLAALVTALVRFRPEAVEVTLEEEAEVIRNRTILTAVTVGPSVGGGFLLSPRADPLDGFLDLFFAEALSMGKIARYVPRVVRGTHEGIPEIHQRRIRHAVVERADGEAFHFEMDGEVAPRPTTRLEIEIRKAALPVLLPRGSRERTTR